MRSQIATEAIQISIPSCAKENALYCRLFCFFNLFLVAAQLHDIVLEYVTGVLNAEQTREAHRCLVHHFREARPAHGDGRGGIGWQTVMTLSGKPHNVLTFT